MASQPMPDLAASAMNALAHAFEALYTPRSNPVARMAALRAAELIAAGLAEEELDQPSLALGALLAGYASGLAGFAVHHAVCQTIVRMCGSPHAQTNAIMLPHFVRIMELRAREQTEKLRRRARARSERRGAAAEAVERLARRAEAGRLSYYGVEQRRAAGDRRGGHRRGPSCRTRPSRRARASCWACWNAPSEPVRAGPKSTAREWRSPG